MVTNRIVFTIVAGILVVLPIVAAAQITIDPDLGSRMCYYSIAYQQKGRLFLFINFFTVIIAVMSVVGWVVLMVRAHLRKKRMIATQLTTGRSATTQTPPTRWRAVLLIVFVVSVVMAIASYGVYFQQQSDWREQKQRLHEYGCAGF